MVRILLVWEEGCGWGHVVPLRRVAGELVARGHEVVFAARELDRAQALFADLPVPLWQAPFLHHTVPGAPDPPSTLAHAWHVQGFGDPDALAGAAGAWRTLFEHLEPDLILCDSAPLALLAARAVPAKRATFGWGWCHFPDVHPLQDLRPELGRDPATLLADELAVLANANALLAEWGLPPMDRLMAIESEVDEAIVTTFPELDHFGPRDGVRYAGPVSHLEREPEEAEDLGECRVFAYLKPFPAMTAVFEMLAEGELPSVVCCDRIEPEVRARYASPKLRFHDRLVDIDAAARACDVAILNAGHGATAAALLAGAPLLLVPLHLEQEILARRVEALGAGLAAGPAEGARLGMQLWTLLEDDRYRRAARAFAAAHAGFDPGSGVAAIVDRLEATLGS